MRILITGFVVLVIWSFFSMWLYVDVLKPQTKKQPVVQPVAESQNREADSLARLYASMPKDLSIFFEFDQSKMLPSTSSETSIAGFKAWLAKYPSALLLVTGHTDFIGTPEYNQKLAAKRAAVVKQFLENNGVPSDKILTSAAVADKDLVNQITSSERAENRKADVTIKK